MVPLPTVANTIRVDFNWHLEGDVNAINRFFFTYSGTNPDASACDAIAGAFASAWGADLEALLCSTYSLNQVTVQDLNSSSGASGLNETATTGSRDGTPLPVGVCVVLNHAIPRRYRGGKPRSYLPFGVEGDQTNNQTWGSEFLTAVAVDWASFITAALAISEDGTSVTNHVNVSYYSGYNAPTTLPSGRVKQGAKVRSAVPTPDVISVSTPSAVIGSQRRRYRS